MNIYIVKNGQQTGPFAIEQIRDAIASGSVSPSDLAWHDGLPNWIPLSSIPEMQLAVPPPVPAPRPVPAAAPVPQNILQDPQPAQPSAQHTVTANQVTLPQPDKSRITAGLLGILLGTLGIHKFYLGYNSQGVIQLIVGILTCGCFGIIGSIEGIIYLTKSDESFQDTYVRNKKTWF